MVENRKNSFEFLGYDFMIDTDLKVWLIEVNSSPSMDYSTVYFVLFHFLINLPYSMLLSA